MNRRLIQIITLFLFFIIPIGAGLSGFNLPGPRIDQNPVQATLKPPVAAPDDNAVNRVARQMYCPVCENIPLDVCPTQACNEWRELIRLRLSQGWSDQQIKDYFVAQYGDRVLAEPPRRGFNWLVYILPPIFLLVGAYILYRVLSEMRRKSAARLAAAGETPASTASDQIPANPLESNPDAFYLRRLEEELKKKG